MEIQCIAEAETSENDTFSSKSKCGQMCNFTLTKKLAFKYDVSVNFDEIHQTLWQKYCPDILENFFDKTWFLNNHCTSEAKALSVIQSTKDLLADGKYDEISRYFYGKTNRKRFVEMPSDCGLYPDKYLLHGDVLKLDNFEAVYMGNKQVAWYDNNEFKFGSFPSNVVAVFVMTCRIRYLSPTEMIFIVNKLLNLKNAQTYQIINNFQLFQKLCAQGHGRAVGKSDTPSRLPKTLNAFTITSSVVVRSGVTVKSWSIPINAVNNIAKPIKTINISYAATVAAAGKEIPLSDLMVLAGKVSYALTVVTSVALPIAVICDICRLYYSFRKDRTNENGDKRPRKFIITAASIAAGWGGGFAGGWAGNATGMAIGAFIGSCFGGIGAIPGAFFGGIAGSIVFAIAGSLSASYAARRLALHGTEFAFGYMPGPNALKCELIPPRSQVLLIWQTPTNCKLYYIDIDIKKNEYINIPLHTNLEEYLKGLTDADKEGFTNVVYAGYYNQNILDIIEKTFEDPIDKCMAEFVIIVPNYVLFAAALISTSNYRIKDGQIIQLIGISDDETFTVNIKLNATGFDIININQILDSPNSTDLPMEVQSGLVIAVKMELTPKTERLMEELCQNQSANTFLIAIQKECAECMSEFIIKTREKVMEKYKPNLDALQLAIEGED